MQLEWPQWDDEIVAPLLKSMAYPASVLYTNRT